MIGIALLVAGITRSTRADESRDFLYIGDASNTPETDTVQRFDATTGAYLGPFITVGKNGCLTQSAGLALIKEKINVNGISPGVVDTPMWDEVDAMFARYENRPVGEKKRLVGESVPYNRMGIPEDLPGAAVFLASSDSDYVVAQTLNVDGGNRMS